MAVASSSTVAYIYKNVYSGKKPENLASRDRILLSLLRKEGGFSGLSHIVAIGHGNNMGVSSVFGTAQTNADTTKGEQFSITRARKFGVGAIDNESAAAAGDDKGSFVRMVTTQMDSTVDELGHRLAIAVYGDGSGQIGRVSSVGGGVITLTYPDDTRNFSKGQVIRGNPNRTGNSGTLSAAAGTVTAVDEDAGTVTYSGTITGIAANDYLYMDGDYDADIKGLGAWIPLTAPTGGDSFFGVDRSTAPQRLAGYRVTTTTSSIEENFKKLGAKIRRAGGRPKHAFLSPMNWNTLQNNLEDRIVRDEGGDAVFGKDSLVMATPAGMVRVYSDPECPPDRGFMLDLNTWYLKHLGPGMPHICDEDGLRMLRDNDTDGVEYRFRYWGQLVCTAPGYNGVIQIPTS